MARFFFIAWAIWHRRNKQVYENKDEYQWGHIFDQKKARIGVILRDLTGKILFTAIVVEHEIPDPKTIEVLAILQGFQLCLNQGIPNLLVEYDCMLVSRRIQ